MKKLLILTILGLLVLSGAALAHCGSKASSWSISHTAVHHHDCGSSASSWGIAHAQPHHHDCGSKAEGFALGGWAQPIDDCDHSHSSTWGLDNAIVKAHDCPYKS